MNTFPTRTTTRTLARFAACLAVTCALAVPAAAEPALEIATLHAGPTGLVWQPAFAVEQMVLTVAGPGGSYRFEFDANTAPSFDLYDADGYPLADGTYGWELRALPELDSQVRSELHRARATGDMSRVESLQHAGQLPDEPLMQSGSFSILNGTIVGDAEEPRAPAATSAAASSGGQSGIQSTSGAAQVFVDDVIVDGSACIGIDCASNESFGFDTLRLKENNLRIKFDDTSASGSFPNNDWQLTANDSSNGGQNRFSIDDVTNSKTPFTVAANAPNHALYLEAATGDVGLGTSTPAVELHVVDGDSPTLRLEQDGSSGFTSQTWDIAGNETNFFVRDVTGGSKLPFRIFPGSPDDTLTIDDAGNGRVGVGTETPDASLHVRGSDGDTELHVEEASASQASRKLLTLENNGQLYWQMVRSDGGGTWTFTHNGASLSISKVGTGVNEMSLDENGNVEFRGTVTGDVASPSARALKTDFAALDPREILSKVAGLPVLSWRYKADTDGSRVHMGPMAEDFNRTFGVGAADRIFLADVNGVALAAIQGLNQVVAEAVEEKDAALDELKAENEGLAARVEALEAMVAAFLGR